MAAHAHVITLGLNHDLNKSIRAWFSEFNFLPPLPLTSAKLDAVVSGVTLEDLLRRMIASPHKNFILIIHGYEDGSGLYLSMAQGQTKPHTTHFDLQRLMDLDGGNAPMKPADYAKMGISKHHVDTLLDLMHQVRSKKIDCIEFRSCNLGRNQLSLNRFRQFFGARLAGAPEVHTLFGLGPAATGPHALDVHTRDHTGGGWETYKFPHAMSSPRLVACFQLNALQKPESGGHIAADSPATLDSWIKKFLMTTGSHKGGWMPVHGLWIADREVIPKDPKQPHRFVPAALDTEPEDRNSPLDAWGGPTVRRFIPPLSENYAKHIIYSR